MNKEVKIIKLADNNNIPQLGYGTWKILPEMAEELVLQAYKIGYRHFDTAQIYNNEWEIGKAIQKLDRKSLFITTKVWIPNYHNREIFLQSIKQSLKRLHTDYVDLLLLHWPIKNKNVQAYKWLEEAKDLDLTKSIGVSNFMIDHLKEILQFAKYPPVINQIEFQPLVQQKKLVKFCQENNIKITGYSNIRSYVDNQMDDKTKNILENIAKKLNRTVPEIILRFVYQEGIIIIPKSVNHERMRQNLNITNFNLTETQMTQIRNLDANNYTKAQEIYEQKLWAKETMALPNFLFDQHFES